MRLIDADELHLRLCDDSCDDCPWYEDGVCRDQMCSLKEIHHLIDEIPTYEVKENEVNKR